MDSGLCRFSSAAFDNGTYQRRRPSNESNNRASQKLCEGSPRGSSTVTNNLEPSVIELFESVVRRLEQCGTVVNDRAAVIALIDDGLQLVGRMSEVAMVIAEVVKHYRG